MCRICVEYKLGLLTEEDVQSLIQDVSPEHIDELLELINE